MSKYLLYTFIAHIVWINIGFIMFIAFSMHIVLRLCDHGLYGYELVSYVDLLFDRKDGMLYSCGRDWFLMLICLVFGLFCLI